MAETLSHCGSVKGFDAILRLFFLLRPANYSQKNKRDRVIAGLLQLTLLPRLR